MQLDLLACEPPAELMQPVPDLPVLQSVKPEPNWHAIAWWEAKASFYLRLMNKFMGNSNPCARTEITRLHQLRQDALSKIEVLQNG